MTRLPVNEIFQTLQGEAFWTGTPSVFVRLQGCDVGCPWCDTKHTWAIDPAQKVPAAVMLEKTDDAATFCMMSPGDIVSAVDQYTSRLVVLTGGEPCQHDLIDLTSAFETRGRRVQIETSGTQEVKASANTWVTLSPKIAMPGGLEVRSDALWRADEIKMPIGKQADVEKLDALLAAHPIRTNLIWLQPLSESEKATRLCINTATIRGWRVSIQVHKLLGVR